MNPQDQYSQPVTASVATQDMEARGQTIIREIELVELSFSTEDEEEHEEEDEGEDEEESCHEVREIDPYGDGHHNEETKQLLQEFRTLLSSGGTNDFVFACGGSLPIDGFEKKHVQLPVESNDPAKKHGTEERRASVSTESSASTSFANKLTVSSCKPVTLRWDPSDPATPASHCKLVFPLEQDTANNLGHLVNGMAPATFGMGGKDVYDETYRKALKLDPSQFAIDFCPYESGIINVIAQMLLPTLNTDLITTRGIRAELYKLNIYAGPSGRFRAHVDTPRSETQFGSLVVCLPVAHEGGRLEVWHRWTKTSFDWSQQGEFLPAIQWAAFYSDCEHEVLEVSSGHRVTLTYNLYAVHGQVAGRSKTLDAAQAPLYRQLRTILDNKDFMPQGGYLGFYTVHAYPHSAETSCLPYTLKGLDMAMWECFQAAGCGVCLRPVVKYPENDSVWCDVSPHKFILKYFPAILKSDITIEDQQQGQAWLSGLSEVPGKQTGASKTDLQHFGVAWLNEPDHKEPQVSYIAYGNDATAEVLYSACAIIVEVPPFVEGVGRRRFEKTYNTLFDDTDSE